MTPTEMVELRRSGVKVKDIIEDSGASPRRVHQVMKEAGLARNTRGLRPYVVTVTRVEVMEVEAYNREDAIDTAMARFPDAVRASAVRGVVL